MIIARNLSKSLGNKPILSEFGAQIRPGQITALIGPSGGGKSTFLRALSLLDPPDSGSIVIDDVTYQFPRLNDEPIVPPWPALTVVFQQLFLWPHLTIRRNITLPLQKNGATVNGEVTELIETFGMTEFVDRYPNEVSLGQRQRAALVRALALHPRYLLLDEITSALDVEYVAAMLEHLKDLRQQGVGILLVTHFLDFARRAADQILFMADGRLIESGDATILSQPKSERLARFVSILDSAR